MIKALYVHIPFCDSICDYCDFTKLQYFHNFADQYLDALETDLQINVNNKNLETIYIGGGTPSSLSCDQLERLLKMLLPYSSKVTEYTIEANPESLSLDKIKLLNKYGVNRVSLGVQTTDDSILKAINRKHCFNDVIKCFSLLRENNINNINIDLILGLPNVSKKLLARDIDNILKLNPNHISTYSLTVHENTVFYIKGITEPDQDFARELYDYTHDILNKNGYVHYEISNFARPGFESRHNFVYWNNEEYYAIGLGASGYVGNIRFRNTKNLNKYNQKQFEKEKEIITKKDLKQYQIMLNLRTNKGIDLEKYIELFSEDLLLTKSKEINDLINKKLLFIKNNHLIPTYEGMMILDQIILSLF